MTDRALLGHPALLVTVNFHGISVDRAQAGENALYGKFGYGRYTANAGYRRLLNLFERTGITATWFVPGDEALRNRACIEAILVAGHEVAANGIAMTDHGSLSEEKERRELAEAHEILVGVTGRSPTGWRSPTGILSPQTLPLLAEMGYRYDSSFQDDFHPYFLGPDGGAAMIELPQNEILIDATLWNARATHDKVLKTWIEEFEAARDENCLIHLTLHPRSDSGSGRASRAHVVEQFVGHVLRSGVASFTAQQLADGSASM